MQIDKMNKKNTFQRYFYCTKVTISTPSYIKIYFEKLPFQKRKNENDNGYPQVLV